jgi:hypothetical protein
MSRLCVVFAGLGRAFRPADGEAAFDPADLPSDDDDYDELAGDERPAWESDDEQDESDGGEADQSSSPGRTNRHGAGRAPLDMQSRGKRTNKEYLSWQSRFQVCKGPCPFLQVSRVWSHCYFSHVHLVI